MILNIRLMLNMFYPKKTVFNSTLTQQSEFYGKKTLTAVESMFFTPKQTDLVSRWSHYSLQISPLSDLSG